MVSGMATKKITINEDGANTGVQKVFVDYRNGTFALGTTTAVTGANLVMGLGVGTDIVKIIGSANADSMYVGVTTAVNYQIKATLLKEAPGAGGAAGKTLADIPLNITGTTTNLSVRPDLEAMAKARVQQELDKHKDEIQQKLTDELKGLFR